MSAPRRILENTNFVKELEALVQLHNDGQPCGMVLILADQEEQAMVCNVKEREAILEMLRGGFREVKARPDGDRMTSISKKLN